jgi:hypothetical protein
MKRVLATPLSKADFSHSRVASHRAEYPLLQSNMSDRNVNTVNKGHSTLSLRRAICAERSAPSDLRRAYAAIINDLSNAESNAMSNAESLPSVERRALSAGLIATSSAPSSRSAETNERTPKGHRASAERRAPSLH